VQVFLLNSPPNDPSLSFKLRRVYREFQPEVIDTADFCSWPAATLAALTCRRARRAHVFHGFAERPPRRWRMAGHFLAGWTHYLRAVSANLADQASSLYRIPRRRIDVVPNGVDTDHFDRTRISGLGHQRSATDRPFTCVTTASLTPAKNPLLLVEVARRVGSGVHFVWIGDGPLKDEFVRQINRQGVQDSFTLPGSLDEVRPHLAGADAFVLPSSTEALPMCVLEAMAMQLPVIATRVGDLERLIRPAEAGVLVDAGDGAALAAAIEKLRDSPDRCREMGRRGRSEVIERYSLGRMLDAYQRAYERLCPTKGAVGRLSAVAAGGAG
jgi:glycosyltransferase involved in cell wall biosynthesis